MGHRKQAVFNWSGGKDSALALQHILTQNDYEVVSLLTTMNEETLKSSVHAIPLEILLKQAESIGLPLYTVLLAKDLSNYSEGMSNAVNHFKAKGVSHFIYGDISLSAAKTYREQKLHPLGIEVVTPLWHYSSEKAMDAFLKSEIEAKIVVTQADKLNQTFIGQKLDKNILALLPEGVDVCGENGEYHTLVYAGGLFTKEISFALGETRKITYDITLDNGKKQTFEYWQANLIA